jgi:O-antigen/teichoic acid export membrane protein
MAQTQNSEQKPEQRRSSRGFSAHVALTLATRILMAINSVGAGIIIARWLGAEGLGAFAVISVTIATAVQLSNAGLPSANTYFIARNRNDLYPVAVNSLLFAAIGGGLLACALVLLAVRMPGLFGSVPPKLLSLAALAIPFQLVNLLGLNIFLATGRIDRFNLLDLLGQSFILINALLALVLLRDGLVTLVALNTAASVVTAMLVAYFVGREIGRGATRASWHETAGLFRRMLLYGIKFHIATLASLLVFRLDLLVVNHFRGTAEAGVYSVTSQVAMMLMLLPGVIASLLFPKLTSARDTSGDLICRVTRHTAFIMLLICLAAAPIGFVLPLLYGSGFADLPIQLVILLPGVLLVSIESVMVQHFSAAGLPRTIPLLWVVTLAVNLALTFALVPGFGARGAAVASTLSYALIFALVFLYFRAATGIRMSTALILKARELREMFRPGGAGLHQRWSTRG